MSYNICLFLSDLLSMIVSRSIHVAQMALFYKSWAHEQCAGDLASIPGLGRSPGEGKPTPVFLPGEFHRQRSLAGYSPGGCKELDTTEGLTHTHVQCEDIHRSFWMIQKEELENQERSQKSHDWAGGGGSRPPCLWDGALKLFHLSILLKCSNSIYIVCMGTSVLGF